MRNKYYNMRRLFDKERYNIEMQIVRELYIKGTKRFNFKMLCAFYCGETAVGIILGLT